MVSSTVNDPRWVVSGANHSPSSISVMKSKITFIKVIDKNGVKFSLFTKSQEGAIYQGEKGSLTACRFLLDHVTVKQAEAHAKTVKDWSKLIDIVPTTVMKDGVEQVFGKVVEL